MTVQYQHPMDHIEVRPLKFNLDDIEDRNPVWSRTHPLFSIYINALSIHIPYFERFLGFTFRAAKQDVDDPQLKKDMTSITGQEAHHARNFVAFNEYMMQRYPEVKSLDADAKAYFAKALESEDLAKKIGFIAGYETFTFLGGMIILDQYDRWMADADPVLRALWVWHQVEEVEHGAVAYDVYQYFYGEHEWRRKFWVAKTYLHIGVETLKAYIPMCRREGYFKTPLLAAKALGFYVSFSMQLAYSALPVLKRGYHPREHPFCTTAQNPIAVAWRKLYQEGDGVMKLDNDRMQGLRN